MRRLLCLMAVLAAASLHAAAQQQRAAVAASNTTRPVTRLMSGRTTPFSSTIQGNALSSTNGQMANVPVRLRDARYGRILDLQLTDQSGLFAFRGVDPGSYIVEMMGADHATVLAASQLLNVNAGEAASAVVKLPFRMPPFAGLAGASTPSAAAVATQAAASGVLAVTTPPGLVGPTCALR